MKDVLSQAIHTNDLLFPLFCPTIEKRKETLVACLMSLITIFALDALTLLQRFAKYVDGSIVAGLRVFLSQETSDVAIHFFIKLFYLLTLYTTLAVTLIANSALFWNSLQTWNAIGIVLSLIQIPFTRRTSIFTVINRLLGGYSLRILAENRIKVGEMPSQKEMR